MNKKKVLFLVLIYIIGFQFLQAQEIYPKEVWQEITNPEQIGWSVQQLNEAKVIADDIGSDAVLIIHRGAILKAWGEIDRKFMCHSMRKSLLSTLIGIHVDNGTINLKQTLLETGIDDAINPLTEVEKSASIEDLLSSRSGIYLPAAYEWPTRKPQRGKYKPGENWLYPNNWDYNTLLTIYEKETQKKIFEDFQTTLAIPLQMQDYEISDGYYHYEKNKSSHPAYPFRMSARDLARVGLLFLRKGKWEDAQIISSAWVEKSTSPISQTYAEGEGYGYLWWVDEKNFTYDYYSAEGTGGHGLIVVPELALVIVHRTNTYIDKRISYQQRGKLISKIMESYRGNEAGGSMELKAFDSPKVTESSNSVAQIDTKIYEGVYKIEKLNAYESDTVEIGVNKKNQLEIFIPYKGYFAMHPINKYLFVLEDSNEYISFLLDEKGLPEKILYHRNSRIGERTSN